jgi:exopolysaccharide biosynthesis polyprenyl glycosylphosphotransferase
LAGTKIDDRTLRSDACVVDAANVSNGTIRDDDAGCDPLGIPEVAGEHVRERHPGYLRVVTTITADAIALVAAAILAGWIGDAFSNAPLIHRVFAAFDADPRGGVTVFLVFTPYWLAALWAFGLYREAGRSIGGMNLTDTLSGLTALTSASWLVLIVSVVIYGARAPVAYLIAFWAFAIVLVPVARWLTRITVWSRSTFDERVLIIGAGQVGHSVAAKFAKHSEYRVELVGFLDDGEPLANGDDGPPARILGALDDLKDIVARQQIDRVIVAFSRARHNDFLRVVRACADTEVRVNIVPRLFEVVSSRALVDDVEGIPLLDIGHAELNRVDMAVKRIFDLVVAGLLSLFLLPIIGVLAVVIKLDSRGPVFYRQARMGRGGKTFEMFKLRSMFVDADKRRLELADQNEYSGPMFKIHQDPRLTRVGGWLRRWSLDELPQILNVLTGDMSLVGPRPLWVEEAKQCRGWTQKRLDITPGMTGLWQVLGRSDIPFDEMVKLDYMYVTSWSLSWDIKLMLQTLPAVLNKRGAY